MTAGADFAAYLTQVDSEDSEEPLILVDSQLDVTMINHVLSEQGRRPLNYRQNKAGQDWSDTSNLKLRSRRILDKDSYCEAFIRRELPNPQGVCDDEVIETLGLDVGMLAEITRYPDDNAAYILTFMEQVFKKQVS